MLNVLVSRLIMLHNWLGRHSVHPVPEVFHSPRPIVLFLFRSCRILARGSICQCASMSYCIRNSSAHCFFPSMI